MPAMSSVPTLRDCMGKSGTGAVGFGGSGQVSDRLRCLPDVRLNVAPQGRDANSATNMQHRGAPDAARADGDAAW